MRIGKYVRFLTFDDRIFAYNAINGGLCEVEQTVYEKIMEGRFDEIRLVDPTIYNELRKTFYIVSDDFDELSFVKYQTWKSKFKNDVFAITIAPTMDCNFKCFYCYQQDYKQPEYISKETADKVISFIKQLINQNTKVSVAWYGGEPLNAILRLYKLLSMVLEK